MSPQNDSPYVRPDGTPARILVVDDEVFLADLLAAALRHTGWETRTASNGWEALDAADEFDPDVVVLDIQMPGLDGMETLERLRKKRPHLPVLFLTARDAVADRVAGLRAGADDYVTKPFDLDEVAARIDALLRRSGMASQTVRHVLTVGDLVLDEDSHDVTRAGEPVLLTNTEFEVLRYLMENPNIVLSKAQILDRVWSYDFGGQANVVELYISYLRKKIEGDRPAMIHTVRGAGYILRPAPDPS
ncbi:response regulator transcription factor [Schaalia sp. 19OD2882]|uniref:response regulator transcription factor n=1 Tax=Schaalia sp. 19OD2882 TaxID=2794089 RepID=UPI001C1F00F9|nr:response regulator transcription factor [Schaalia sp. 19OD2882]